MVTTTSTGDSRDPNSSSPSSSLSTGTDPVTNLAENSSTLIAGSLGAVGAVIMVVIIATVTILVIIVLRKRRQRPRKHQQ